MYLVRIAAGAAVLLALAIGPLDAASKGAKGQGSSPAKASSTKPPKTATAPKAPKTSTSPKGGPKTTAVTTKASKADAKLARVETNASNSRKTGTVSTASTPTNSSTGSTSTQTIDFTEGKVGAKLAKNGALRSKLESQLKALGYDGTVYQAAYGFKNQGQLVAAINNAQNHDMSFEQLKTLMTGWSVDASGVVLKANLNPDGSVTMLPPDDVTNPAPTKSLGQAKKTIATPTSETAVGN